MNQYSGGLRLEVFGLIAGLIIAWIFVRNVGGGIITFFIAWTIATFLSVIALALFGFLFGLALFVGIIIAFIFMVKKIIVG